MSSRTQSAARRCAVIAAAVLTLAACGGGAATPDEAEAPVTEAGGTDATTETEAAAGGGGGGESIGLAGSFLTDPFQVVLVNGIGEQAGEAGLDLSPPTNADADPGKQVTDITTLVSQGVNGLIVIPVDSDAVVPAIESANAEDVPVVTVDVAPTGGDVYMIVRADNVAMGASACEHMGEALGGTGTVLELQGNLASVNGLDRSEGFNDCMTENFPDIEIISRPTDWVAQQATDAAQTVLSTTDVQGVFLASDSVMLPGVINVLQNQDKWFPVGEEGHVTLVSIDGTPPGLQTIRDGYQDALVSQPVDLYAQYSVQYVADAIAGTEYEPGPTDHDSEIVEEGGLLSDLLPSPLVTAENVDDPALWGNSAE